MFDPGFPPFVMWLREKALQLPIAKEHDDPETWDDWVEGRWNIVANDLLAILAHAYPAGVSPEDWCRVATAAQNDWFYPFNDEVLEFLAEHGNEPVPAEGGPVR